MCRCCTCGDKKKKTSSSDKNGGGEEGATSVEDSAEEGCEGCVCCGAGTALVAAGASRNRGTPRQNAGQWGSLILMIVAILTALIWEFYFATSMHNSPATQAQWEEKCEAGVTSSYPQCAKYQAAYRVSFVTTCFFLIMAAVSSNKPHFHDEGWDLKFFGWIVLLIGFTFVPNSLFLGYVWVARILAFLFLIFQQIILIVRLWLYIYPTPNNL